MTANVTLPLFVLLLASQGQAAGVDYKSAAGTVLIAAPTAAGGPTNQGIWFVNARTKAFSLQLPALAADEVYESIVIDNCTGKRVTGGLFRASGGIDSDFAGPYAGPLSLNVPPLPGSDYVTLGDDLGDGSHEIVVEITAYPKVNAMAKGIPILSVNVPANVEVGTELIFQNVAP